MTTRRCRCLVEWTGIDIGAVARTAAERAVEAAMLRDGLKAVTIRVNDVEGVAGFILPGDYVDVALTRQNEKIAATTDIILQSARVLAIDRHREQRAEIGAAADVALGHGPAQPFGFGDRLG